MKFATLASITAFTCKVFGKIVIITEEVIVTSTELITSTYCPETDTASPPTSFENEEIEYVTIYQTTYEYSTTHTAIVTCLDANCLDPLTIAIFDIQQTSDIDALISEALSTSVEAVSSSSLSKTNEEVEYVTEYSTTTERPVEWVTTTACSNGKCSEVESSSVSDIELSSVEETVSSDVSELVSTSKEIETTSEEGSMTGITSLIANISTTSLIESTESTTVEVSEDTESIIVYSYSLESPSTVQPDLPPTPSIESSSSESDTTTFEAISSIEATEIEISFFENQIEVSSESIIIEETSILLTSSEISLDYLSSNPPAIDTTLAPPLSTTANIETTIITITSCSDDKCFEKIHTTGLTTVIKDTTVYTTFCPTTHEIISSTSLEAVASSATLESNSSTTEASSSTTEASSSSIKSSSTYTTIAAVTYVSSTEVATSSESSLEPVVSTKSEVHTTIITITSCEDNSCTEVVHTTGLTTVTEETTIYTTYCSFPTSIEVASSEKPSVSSKAEKVVSFSTLLSPVESSVEFSLSIPPAPYSLVELRTVSYSGVEYSTSLAATVASSESISSIQSHVEKSTSTAKSTSPIKVLKVMTSVAAPTTLFVKDHSAKVIESVIESSRVATTEEATTKTTLKDIKVATSEKPQAPVTTIIFYNTEEESTTTITSTIETASHIEGTELNAPQPTPESVPEYAPQESIIPEDVTLATITTITDSTSLVYTSKESPVVSANPEAPIASTYEGSGVVNIPALAAIVGLLLSLV